MLRRVALVVAFIAAFFAVPATNVSPPDATKQSLVCVYAIPAHHLLVNHAAPDQGPSAQRAEAVVSTGQRVADRASHGVSVRSAAPGTSARTTYDSTAQLVQVDNPGTTSLKRWSHVAANTAAKKCSFAGATVVLMANGTKRPIEEIEVGDEVVATDPETGEQEAKAVEHVWVHDDTVTDLVVDREVITTTEDHPFWSVTDQRFERADELADGEQVLGADGEKMTVSGLRVGTERVALAYNLTVEGIHTYHVGQSDVLVHNTCPITGLRNGDHLPTSKALDKAEQFLGNGYKQAGSGRFLSPDGLRQVRMTDADLVPRGGQLPHLNFETWSSPVTAGGRNKISSNLHIYLPEEF